MNLFALFRPLLQQSFKTTGIYLLMIALTLAISATTALKFSNVQIQNAVALQAAEMLAADLVLSDNDPISDEWQQQATERQLKQSKVTMFSSMAHTDQQFVMVNVKAVDAQFPLRGELRTEPNLNRPIQAGEVWLSQRAMELLHVQLGDTVNIADAAFKVTAKISHDSNQELGFGSFSPTVMIAQQEVARTNAVQVGSRIEYRLLMSGAAEQTQDFEKLFKQKFGNSSESNTDQAEGDAQTTLKLRNASAGNTRLMKPIANLETFLQLANILTILLCGIAIALTSQRYVQQNQDAIALMRCIGATKQQILMAYLGLLAVVLGISMLLGSALGLGLGYALLQLMLELIPNLQLQFSAISMLVGPLPMAILTSAIVLLGFIFPSLWQLLKTPPARVIRQQERSARSMIGMLLAGTLSLLIFCVVLTENLQLTLWVMGAIITLCVILYLGIWLILRMIKGLGAKISMYVRTPYQTAFQITALALGLSLVTVLAVLRTDLLERWQQQLPEGTPNQFVYGLPPFELDNFNQQLQRHGWQGTPMYPNIRGRLVAKNDHPFADHLIKTNNSLRRELNLTQAESFPADNQILQGAKAFQQVNEVSVEAKTAQELGIQIGDRLTFTLPEGVLEAKVINLRSVEWESFSPNFFFIFSPQTMDENAGSYLGSFYVPEADKGSLIELIQQFSNTVFIDVSLILDEIKRVVSVLIQIISILALLVSISGILVLIACLNLLMDERKKEVALLRSFGSSKQKLKSMLTTEIGFIGLISGIVACLFAEVISAIASYKMELLIQPHWEIWLILPILMTLLCALIGRYRLSYLCDIPPLESLRELNS